ncbi:hypothetical protein AC1031_004363 [Aphanomyces cochlioides]|nr:hypothetical protein AC1031_004363 [Aphanomyces cochlioides]
MIFRNVTISSCTRADCVSEHAPLCVEKLGTDHTTPPFTEGVEWTVLEEVQTMSKAQFDEYKHVMHETSAREVQPLNGRTVTFLAKDRAQC